MDIAGTILAWDLRDPTSCVWRCSGSGSATGLRLTNDANQVVVASIDGSLRVLEVLMKCQVEQGSNS